MSERSMSAMSAVGTRPMRVPRLDRRTVVILSIMAKLGWVIPVVVGIAMRVVGASAAVVVSGIDDDGLGGVEQVVLDDQRRARFGGVDAA